MTPTVRVFVNAIAIDMPAGSTALDAVRMWDGAAAAAVDAGARVITDSRGLPISGGARVSAGSIFRVIPCRPRSDDERDT